jgi:hypothetical protein
MLPGFAEARPPYLEFERRPVERRKSLAEGGDTYYEEVDFVIITPIGSKDRVEKIAREWLDNLAVQVRAERYPEAWLEAHRKSYAAFQANQELPVAGTPIRAWPVASPGEVKALLAWNVRTVEDLAQANEETIQRLGMGGRTLKQRAQDWLNSKSDHGATVRELEALRATNKALAQRLEVLEQEVHVAKNTVRQAPVPDLQDRLEAAQSAAAAQDTDLLDKVL